MSEHVEGPDFTQIVKKGNNRTDNIVPIQEGKDNIFRGGSDKSDSEERQKRAMGGVAKLRRGYPDTIGMPSK